MKLSFGGITSSVRSPLTWATASLTLLWGCQHSPGPRSCRTSDDAVCYQYVTAPNQQSASSYEESPGVPLNNPASKESSPKLLPLGEDPELAVPSKKPPTPELKKEAPNEPTIEKPAEPKPADTDKPTTPKKKPAKPIAASL